MTSEDRDNRDDPNGPDDFEDDYLCLGVCLPDEEGRYCIGCGRPWQRRESADWDTLKLPPVVDDEPDAAD